MSKIKILFCGTVDKAGGIENYLLNYCQQLDYSKYEIEFINVYPSARDEKFYHELSKYGKFNELTNYRKHPFKFIKEFVKLNKKNEYNILHYNMNSACYIVPLIAAKISKIKTIIAHAHNSASDRGILKVIVHNINRKFVTRFANTYFACSDKAGKWFFSKKILNSQNYYVIKNAINTSEFKYNEIVRRKLRDNLNIEENTTLIGHVGRFNKQKNHDFLIDIFFEYNKKNRDSKLCLIGYGALEQDIKNKVRNLKLDDNVIFLGEKNNVNEYMMAMDIFILPSLYEGLPLVAIEAQATGLPCIISNSITDEVCITHNINKLKLSLSAKDWANEISKMENIKIKREEAVKEVKTFDIKENAITLQKLYYDFCHEKIKICHFINGITNGGVERFLINYFSNINKERYEIHIISQGNSDKTCLKELKALGFKIHIVTKKRESLIKNYKEIHNILKYNKFDIVHCHMSTTNFFPLLYSWISGVKVRINHSHLAVSELDLRTKFICTLAKIFDTSRMACSNDAAIWLFGSNKNVIIMNNAINIEEFKFDGNVRKKIRSDLKINDKFVIGHIGRFVEQKNHDFLIDVFSNLYRLDNRYKLLLVGIGELENKIKNKVKQLECEESVIFLETRDDISDLYQAMDLFVLPSLFEGLGIVLIEAQVNGLKCISSDKVPIEAKITDNMKILELNKEKWVSEIRNIKNYERCSNIENARNKGFDIKTEAIKLDKLYKNLVESRKK